MLLQCSTHWMGPSMSFMGKNHVTRGAAGHRTPTTSYNYRWENIDLNDLHDGILLVNSKKAFAVKYIQYHENASLPWALGQCCSVSCFPHRSCRCSWTHCAGLHKLHVSALLYMAIRELIALNLRICIRPLSLMNSVTHILSSTKPFVSAPCFLHPTSAK